LASQGLAHTAARVRPGRSCRPDRPCGPAGQSWHHRPGGRLPEPQRSGVGPGCRLHRPVGDSNAIGVFRGLDGTRRSPAVQAARADLRRPSGPASLGILAERNADRLGAGPDFESPAPECRCRHPPRAPGPLSDGHMDVLTAAHQRLITCTTGPIASTLATDSPRTWPTLRCGQSQLHPVEARGPWPTRPAGRPSSSPRHRRHAGLARTRAQLPGPWDGRAQRTHRERVGDPRRAAVASTTAWL
jgi:hypothetical protein